MKTSIDLIMQLAHRAVADPALIAGQIDAAARQERLAWEEMAIRLGVSLEQLAQLALCRRPRPAQFTQDVERIADTVGVAPQILVRFLQQPVAAQAAARAAASHAARTTRPVARTKSGGFSWLWAGALVLLLVVLLSAFAFGTSPRGQATVLVSQGEAQVFTAPGAIPWMTPAEEVKVSAGQMLLVGEGARVVAPAQSQVQLQFNDGTVVELEANSEVVVQELVTTSGAYRIRLQQAAGETLSRVKRLLGLNDYFEILTPSSTVSVRGTIFQVAVLSDDETFVAVSDGLVQVRMGDAIALVEAGQQLKAQVGQPLQVEAFGEPTPVPLIVPPVVPTSVPTVSDPAQATAPAPVVSTPGASGVPGVSSQATSSQPTAGIEPTAGNPPSDPPSSTENPPAPPSGSDSTKQVPGNPPSDNPGSPPPGGAEPPGHDRDKDKTPKP